MEIPRGLCQCGCGEKTPIATRNRWELEGYVKGQPTRCLPSHCAHSGTFSHGMTGSPEYKAYFNAKQRCINPKNTHWEDYGGRGIKFLFTSFEQFFAEIGLKPKGTVLDREHNNGNYEPGNVRWVTLDVSSSNTRLRKDNTSGQKGVNWHKDQRKWHVVINKDGKRYYVGSFKSFRTACAARTKAEKEKHVKPSNSSGS